MTASTIRRAPGPSTPLFGVTFANRFRNDPLGVAEEIKNEYGDIACVRIGPVDWYMVNHPDLVKEVLVTRSREFGKTERLKKVLGSVDGNGLVLSEGEFWLKQRRIIQPAFNHDHVRRYADVMLSETQRAMSRWPNGAKIDLAEEMTSLTLTIIAKILFNVNVESEAKKLGDAVTTVSNILFKEFSDVALLPDWVPLPSKIEKRRAVSLIDSMINKSIAARQKSTEPGEDLLSMLLAARDTEGDGTGMTAKQLRDEAVTLFNAGHDTTATTLSWTWYLLMKHPDIYERLLIQIDTVLGADTPTPSDIAQIPLLTAILKESMRLYPAAWILPRQCNNDLELGGYSLSKGSLVNLFPYVLQRDARFFDDPNSFLPERFLPDNEKKLHPFAHIPFGAGPRACIGKDFAMMEMQLLIIEICKTFRFYLQKPNETIQPNPLISLEPKGGIKAVVTVREKN